MSARLAVGVALLAIILAYVLYVSKRTVPASEGAPMSPVKKLVYNKYYVDELYGALIVKPIMWLSEKLYHWIELHLIDPVVNGAGKGIMLGSRSLRVLQTGMVRNYLFLMVGGILLILLLNYFII